LQKFIGSSVCSQTDQNADLFDVFQRGIEFIKPTDEEIANQAIETARVLA
jgi:hypothetical protein